MLQAVKVIILQCFTDGRIVGRMEADGRIVGLRDGFPLDGGAVGQLEGIKVGLEVGRRVERKDGLAVVGLREGEGAIDGWVDGRAVGIRVDNFVGATLRITVGAEVGEKVLSAIRMDLNIPKLILPSPVMASQPA